MNLSSTFVLAVLCLAGSLAMSPEQKSHMIRALQDYAKNSIQTIVASVESDNDRADDNDLKRSEESRRFVVSRRTSYGSSLMRSMALGTLNNLKGTMFEGLIGLFRRFVNYAFDIVEKYI